jgi:hypothetical protein
MPKHRTFLKRVNRATAFGDDNEGASFITRLFIQRPYYVIESSFLRHIFPFPLEYNCMKRCPT